MAFILNDEYTDEQLSQAALTLLSVPDDAAAAIVLNLALFYPEVPLAKPDEVEGDPVLTLLDLLKDYPNEIAEATLLYLYGLDVVAASAIVALYG